MRTKTARQADKILDAAARLFGAHRFHQVRMEDIAAEAEVGKGTLYRYFRDKEELYLALLTRACGQFLARLREEVGRPEGARIRLERVVAAILAYFDAQPHHLDLVQRAEVLQPQGPHSPWQQARDDLFHLVVGLLEEGRRAGEFAVRDPALAVLMLLGGLRSVIRFGRRPWPRDLARRIVADFLHGADTGPRGDRAVIRNGAARRRRP